MDDQQHHQWSLVDRRHRSRRHTGSSLRERVVQQPVVSGRDERRLQPVRSACRCPDRSEEHTSELQSLMRISYAVFCLKKKTKTQVTLNTIHTACNTTTQQTTHGNKHRERI